MSRKSINDSINELKHLTEVTTSKLINTESIKASHSSNSDDILHNEFFVQFAKEFADKFSKKFIDYFTTQLVNNRSF